MKRILTLALLSVAAFSHSQLTPSLPSGVSVLPGNFSFQAVELWKPKSAFSFCTGTPLVQTYLGKTGSPWSATISGLTGFNFTNQFFDGGWSIGVSYASGPYKFSVGFAELYALSSGQGTPGQGLYVSLSVPTH